MTDKKFPTSKEAKCQVPFDTSLTLEISVESERKGHKPRKARIEFTVFRYREGKTKKTFGTFDIDIGSGDTSQERKDYPIQGPHHEESYLNMSFDSVAASESLTADDGTNSVSDIISQKDSPDTWDFSEVDGGQGLKEFLDTRQKRRTSGLGALVSASPNALAVKRRPVVRPGKLRHFMTIPVKQGKEIAAELERQRELERPAFGPTLDEILKYRWENSESYFSRTAAVLYATMLECGVLEKSVPEEALKHSMAVFLSYYKKWVGPSPLHEFCVSLELLLLLSQCSLDESRLEFLRTTMIQTCKTQFMEATDRFLGKLRPVSVRLIEKGMNDEMASSELNSHLLELENGLGNLHWIWDFVKNRLVIKLDALLLTELIRAPNLCRFSHAINLNTMLSMLERELNCEFPMLRDGLAVLMTSMALCADPEQSKVICPHLSNDVILLLLSLQKPDEMMPVQHDVNNFKMHYNMTENETNTVVELQYDGDFTEVTGLIDSGKWKEVVITSKEAEDHPFLRTYFTVKE